MKIQKAIEGAEKGGWQHKGNQISIRTAMGGGFLNDSIFLDPEFWKALGRTEGWCDWCKEHPDDMTECKTYVVYMRRFMEAIIDGKSPEQFFETL